MSRYNQQIKGTNECYKDIFEFLPKIRVALDYRSVLHRWSEQFGEDNVIVRPYEKRQLYNNDLCSDFLKNVLKIESVNRYVFPEKTSNPKLSRGALEFKNLTNYLKLNLDYHQQLQPQTKFPCHPPELHCPLFSILRLLLSAWIPSHPDCGCFLQFQVYKKDALESNFSFVPQN